MHEYYYKEVATRAVVDASSAMPWSMKRTILTQEVVRMVPWKDVCMHIEEFSMRMQFRVSMHIDSDQGSAGLYRPREWSKV